MASKKNNALGDRVLERIINETSKELGIKVDTIWAVYNHFYRFNFKLMTQDKLSNFNMETKRKLAQNISIPGLGKLANKLGKSRRIKTK